VQPKSLASAGKAAAHEHGETVVKRVSRKHDDDGHGGAWKVAFADFCLALLCLFLVLWLMASRTSERLQQVLKDAGGSMLQDGTGVSSQTATGQRGSMIERFPVPATGESPARGDSRHSSETPDSDGDRPVGRARYDSPEQLKKLKAQIDALSAEEGLQANVGGVITPQGLRLMLHDTDSRGMFERGSATPSARLQALLHKLGPVFARMDNQLVIVGHTDASPYNDKGPAAFSNWALSSYRAMAARSRLMEGGMPERSVLQVAGMADSAPLKADQPLAAVNRRIELLVLTTPQARQFQQMFGSQAPSHSLGALPVQ